MITSIVSLCRRPTAYISAAIISGNTVVVLLDVVVVGATSLKPCTVPFLRALGDHSFQFYRVNTWNVDKCVVGKRCDIVRSKMRTVNISSSKFEKKKLCHVQYTKREIKIENYEKKNTSIGQARAFCKPLLNDNNIIQADES